MPEEQKASDDIILLLNETWWGAERDYQEMLWLEQIQQE